MNDLASTRHSTQLPLGSNSTLLHHDRKGHLLAPNMSIFYPIGKSGQYLTFDKNVLNHFEKWRQVKPGMSEAGGQLFGAVDGRCIKLKLATGPRGSDRRGRFFFVADRLVERREIGALHKSGLHYFGDWHTHPQTTPIPSEIDLASMAELYSRSKHELRAFLMVIVGTTKFPDWTCPAFVPVQVLV